MCIHMKPIVAIDFCCGAGGLTKGLQRAGINVIKGIDIDHTVKKTYEYNNPHSIFYNLDMTKISIKKLISDVNRIKYNLMFAGGIPCQPFSTHNKNSKYDRRKSLILKFADFIENVLPEYILIENVPGFNNADNTYRKSFLRILKRHNYKYDERVLNSADYGVPQTRKRYALLASKLNVIYLPNKKYGDKIKPYKTVKNAIKKYQSIKIGESNRIKNHEKTNISQLNILRLKHIPKNGGSRSSLPKHLQLKCHKHHNTHSDVYGRMDWDKPAPTLTCRCTSISNGRFVHPTKNRAITVREAATLQTFPNNYIFHGSKTTTARQVGNAVPVLLGKCLGLSVMSSNKLNINHGH